MDCNRSFNFGISLNYYLSIDIQILLSSIKLFIILYNLHYFYSQYSSVFTAFYNILRFIILYIYSFEGTCFLSIEQILRKNVSSTTNPQEDR